MIDPHLAAIVSAAEAGAKLPPIRVVTAGAILAGTPGRSADVAPRLTHALAVDGYNAATRGRTLPRTKQELDAGTNGVWDTQHAEAAEALAPIQAALTPEPSPEVLTLIDCYVWPSGGGSGLKQSIVRVALSAVAAWWLSDGEAIEPEASGGWWGGVGIMVPLD